MKSLVILTLMMMSLTVSAANVECARGKKYLRPISPDAIKLAEYLKVSTCNGKRFKEIVKKEGATIKEVPATAAFIKKWGQSKKASVFKF